jgi:hypothetical protein
MSSNETNENTNPTPPPPAESQTPPPAAPTRLRKKNAAPRDYGDGVKTSEDLPDGGTESVAPSARSKYEDDLGDPTYYYLNVSNGKVRLTDIDVTVDPGCPIDMFDLADEEEIINSKDLRRSIKSLPGQEPLLRRLENDEFQRLYNRWVKTQQSIKTKKEEMSRTLTKAESKPEEIKKLSNQRAEDDLNVSPKVVSLVNKLRIGNLDVNEKEAQAIVQSKEAGITSEEFLLKFEVLKPNNDEIDYVYSTVMDKDVRSQLKELFNIEE